MSIERSFQPHLTEHASHTHSTMYSKHNVKRNAPLLYAKYVFKFQPFRSMTCSCWLNTQNVKNQSHSTYITKQCFTLFTIKKNDAKMKTILPYGFRTSFRFIADVAVADNVVVILWSFHFSPGIHVWLTCKYLCFEECYFRWNTTPIIVIVLYVCFTGYGPESGTKISKKEEKNIFFHYIHDKTKICKWKFSVKQNSKTCGENSADSSLSTTEWWRNDAQPNSFLTCYKTTRNF